MSNLLTVQRYKMDPSKKGVQPLYMEFQVSSESAPYLVTNSRSLCWVEQIHAGGLIKAAVQKLPPIGDLYRKILQQVVTRSDAQEWGSHQAYTEAGLSNALSYVESFDFKGLEVLVSTGVVLRDWFGTPGSKYLKKFCSWLPAGCAVVLPRDRGFVGHLGYLNSNLGVVVVHNASRGIAVIGDPFGSVLKKGPK